MGYTFETDFPTVPQNMTEVYTTIMAMYSYSMVTQEDIDKGIDYYIRAV